MMWFIVTVSAIFVYFDATKNKVGKIPDKKGFLNMSAGMWSFGVLLLWIIIFPLYLFKRSSLIETAKENPQTVSMRGAKLALLSVICITFSATSLILAPAYNDYLQKVNNANNVVANSDSSNEGSTPSSQSDANRYFKLGERLRTGNGVKQDFAKAIVMYRLAAENGHKDSIAFVKKFDEIIAKEKAKQTTVAQLSYAERYAEGIKSQMMSGGVCDILKQKIDMFATTSAADNIKVRQIDTIVDAADRAGCMMY